MKKTDLDTYFVPLLAAPFVLMVLVIIVVMMVTFRPAISKHDRDVMGFVFEPPVISERSAVTPAALASPIRVPGVSGQTFPLHPLAQLAPPQDINASKPTIKVEPVVPVERQPQVTFIMINERSKMAIINGQVVHEGDSLGKRKVCEIRRDRVSLRGKEGEKWAFLR